MWYPIFEIRLNPMFGAAAMSLSSIFVVGNALRLRGFKSGFVSFRRKKATAGAAPEAVQTAEAGAAMPATTVETTEAMGIPMKENNLESAAKECAERKETMKKVITIEGMMCGHCTGRVQKALEAVAGVDVVTMSLEEKTATVEMTGEVSDEALTAAVTEAGYEVKAVR